jgi:hypothetical protein
MKGAVSSMGQDNHKYRRLATVQKGQLRKCIKREGRKEGKEKRRVKTIFGGEERKKYFKTRQA